MLAESKVRSPQLLVHGVASRANFPASTHRLLAAQSARSLSVRHRTASDRLPTPARFDDLGSGNPKPHYSINIYPNWRLIYPNQVRSLNVQRTHEAIMRLRFRRNCPTHMHTTIILKWIRNLAAGICSAPSRRLYRLLLLQMVSKSALH